MGFDTAVLLISAYANPVETMEHARALGYRCTDFMVTPLPFGYYSSEPKVGAPLGPGLKTGLGPGSEFLATESITG